MINVIYEASSGSRYNLKTTPIRIKKANFHNYSWTRETVSLQYGETVTAFGKKAINYPATLYLDHDPQTLARLHEDFERDIITMTPGKIIWNEDYILCYITASSTYPTAGNAYIANEVNIYCPNPAWIREKRVSLTPQENDGVLGYPYGYDYDYGPISRGTFYAWPYFYGHASFKAVISGPCENPSFELAGNTYGVNVTLQAGETVTIDTRPTAKIGRQVYRGSGSSAVNAYNLRIGSIEPFVSQGAAMLIWSGAFAIDLTLYQERSEPGWL